MAINLERKCTVMIGRSVIAVEPAVNSEPKALAPDDQGAQANPA